MESCSIVSSERISLYKKYERRWVYGWVVSFLFMVACIYLGTIAHARGQALNSLDGARHEIVQLQAQQAMLIDNFIKAWQNQQATADVIIGFGEYHMERKKLINYNIQTAAKEKPPPRNLND